MIHELVAVNYGCLKDVTAQLTPLHAFIGPNDSGKSTILHSIRTVVQFASGRFDDRGDDLRPFDPWLSPRYPQTQADDDGQLRQRIECRVDGGWYRVETFEQVGLVEVIGRSAVGRTRQLGTEPEEIGRLGRAINARTGFGRSPGTQLTADCAPILGQLQNARLVRFDPDALRKSSGLIPRGDDVGFLNERGLGLPGVYQAILGRGDEAFGKIRDSIRERFPTIRRIGVPPIAHDRLDLEVELHDGTLVPAARMSEGLIYYLAFAALPYLSRTSVILVEEPENGLHPSRIADVVSMMRAVMEDTGTQIIIATHSPLVINELKPEEVTVVTRRSTEEGTTLTRIADTLDFPKRSQVYALGELWLSYANGTDEGPLLRGEAG